MVSRNGKDQNRKEVGRPIPPGQKVPTLVSVKYQIKKSYIATIIIERLPVVCAISVGIYESLYAKNELYGALGITFLSYIFFTIFILAGTFAVVYVNQALFIMKKWQKYEKMVEIYKKYNPAEAAQFYFPKFNESRNLTIPEAAKKEAAKNDKLNLSSEVTEKV